MPRRQPTIGYNAAETLRDCPWGRVDAYPAPNFFRW
jgi:hypothetical protein